VIFSDRTLLEMAAYYPMTPASLTKIFGIGTVKASRYGYIFLTLISEYCLPRHISEQPRRPAAQPKPEAPKNLGARFNEVGEAFNAGESIASLVERYSVQIGTILNHLYTFAVQGHTLRQDASMLSYSQLSPEQIQSVMAAFEGAGIELLKPVFDRLNGEVSYDELKLLRVYFLSLKDHL